MYELRYKTPKTEIKGYYCFKMSKKIQKLQPRISEDKQFYYHSAKQDSEGYLYQVLSELDSSGTSYLLSIMRDNER